MTQHLEAISAASVQESGGLRAMDLAAQNEQESMRAGNMSRLTEEALSRAVTRPDVTSQMDNVRADVLSTGQGEVGGLKSDFVSTVDRPGAPEKADTSQSVQDQSEERIRSLYYDLTNYQIAWKIAQRVQQDVTQLLRG